MGGPARRLLNEFVRQPDLRLLRKMEAWRKYSDDERRFTGYRDLYRGQIMHRMQLLLPERIAHQRRLSCANMLFFRNENTSQNGCYTHYVKKIFGNISDANALC